MLNCFYSRTPLSLKKTEKLPIRKKNSLKMLKEGAEDEIIPEVFEEPKYLEKRTKILDRAKCWNDKVDDGRNKPGTVL